MACDYAYPFYLPHSGGGILNAVSNKNGRDIAIKWTKAYASSSQYQLAYNIYFSSVKEDIYAEGVKYVSITPNILSVEIGEFPPGDTYYFAVRATQFLSGLIDFNSLPSLDDVKYYPESVLLQEVADSDTEIFVDDIEQYPNYGVVQVGTELIRYLNKDVANNSLMNISRGFFNTYAQNHEIGLVKHWKGQEEPNEVIYQETAVFTYPQYPHTFADGYKEVAKDWLTTDLSASDASQADFPRFDFTGWRRTDPGALLRGECVGTYFGGQLYCADGYGGVGRMIRGIPINEESHRRLEVLLDTIGTGELCVLLRKQRTGKRCFCYQLHNEHPDERCPSCFTPETLVRAKSGWKKISDIKIGEKVLSGDGTYQKVTNVFVKQYYGILQSILPASGTNPILVTPEHPFLALRGTHRPKYGCSPKYCENFIKKKYGVQAKGGIRKNDNGTWSVRCSDKNKIRHTIGTFKKEIEAINALNKFRDENLDKDHELLWDDAKNIKEKDWLVSKWNDNIKDIKYIEIPKKYRKNTTLGEQRIGSNKFELNEEFLWIIGLYLAEGSSSKRSINFALHKKETNFVEKIFCFFEKYGFHPKLRNSSENGIRVEINSTSLAKWFPNWLGRGCANKKIPEEFITLPINKLKAILQGIYDGDGLKRENEIGQTSEILALQLVEILHRIGEKPLVRIQQSNILTPKGNKRKTAYYVNWAEETATRNNRKGRWKFENEILTKVKKVDQIAYSGLVYNLEVEGNHTYVVQGVVVHNCNGSGFVIGWEQFFNTRRSDGLIKVRFSPTEDKLKLEESGMEPSYITEGWTLVYPIIKDRDILVRLGEDGKEEFRYEVLSVNRNKLLDGLSGAQKMQIQRIRKTDSIYTVRVNYDTSPIPSTLQTSLGFVGGPGGIPPHIHIIKVGTKDLVAGIESLNQLTEISQGHSHNHRIVNGIIQEALHHTHEIIFP